MRPATYARLAWSTLAVTLLVILWGAFVRATGSGAGCGAHWPLCNGQVVPRAAGTETLIELTHRVTSGLALLLVAALAFFAYRSWPAGHAVRRAATWALGFMVLEAAIGAGLVLLELVADDRSVARALWMAAHLVNTFLLLGALALTAWFASGGAPIRVHDGRDGVLLLAGLVALVVVGASGAVAALGDTLFPADSLAAGFRADLSPTAHFLVRLRVLHPALAITTGLYLLATTAWLRGRGEPGPMRSLAGLAGALVVAQLLAGALNLVLLAPVWLQIVHLLLADGLWITVVLLTAASLRASEPRAGPVREARPRTARQAASPPAPFA
ncbi:MAG: COX15/CtaA family protein [Longimicrobiales bacterium]